jgi:hypothetical protein
MGWKRLAVVALAPYVAWLVLAYEYHFLDGVNLAFHEAGHLFLGFAGQTLHFLGGTFGQLFFPLVLVLRFRARGERFEAALCAIWLGESLMNVAVYLGDARAQALPLVGGHTHDWAWLLGRAGLVEHCGPIAGALHVAASAGVLLAWGLAAGAAFGAAPAAPALQERVARESSSTGSPGATSPSASTRM